MDAAPIAVFPLSVPEGVAVPKTTALEEPPSDFHIGEPVASHQATFRSVPPVTLQLFKFHPNDGITLNPDIFSSNQYSQLLTLSRLTSIALPELWPVAKYCAL